VLPTKPHLPILPSPTLSPTDPVPRGLLTLCPWGSSGPQGLYTAYIQPIYSLYAAYMQPIYSVALTTGLPFAARERRLFCKTRPLSCHVCCA